MDGQPGVSARKVQTRRIAFRSTFDTMPRHFARDGDVIHSHIIACLSAGFPDGEDFFVRSVRHYRDQITDVTLKDQVAGFIGQEATHGREHRAFNERLDQLGYPATKIQKWSRRALTLQSRWISPMYNLAQTAALEHVTATLAELILGDADHRSSYGAAEPLFLWHALEESEHKAVAFDVYRAVGGDNRTRVRAMRVVRYGMVISTAVQVIASMLGNRGTWGLGDLRSSWRAFRRLPVLRRSTWERLKDYERADFHPDDWDATELVAVWREELFGRNGTLRDQLVAASQSTAPR